MADQTGGSDLESVDLHHLTTAQLARLGVSQVAYVKAVAVDGVSAFAIHAADGTPLALAGDRDMAIAAVLEHELVLTSVH